MQDKDAFEPKRNVSRHVWTEQLDRYRNLRNKANSVFSKASMSMEKSYRVIDFVSLSDEAENDEDSESSESGDKMEAATFGPLPAYFSRSKQVFTGKVKDPIPIKQTGAPSKKSPKAYHKRFSSKNKAGDI